MTEDTSQEEYNQRFLNRLEVRRPDLVSRIERVTNAHAECVEIVISPPAGKEHAMVISTDREELTMFWDEHHVHFNMFEDDDEQEEFDDFFDYVDAFMKEERVAVLEYAGDRLREVFDAPSDEPIEPKENRRRVVRSWKGTYSRTIE